MDSMPATLDLDSCAREPIRIPGAIQPHGALLVLEPESLRVLQISANAGELFGADVVAGDSFDAVVGPGAASELESWTRGPDSLFVRTLKLGGRAFQLSAHRGAQGLLIEIEP